MEDIYTAGNVLVNKIKVGDIHYEYDMGLGIKCEVITEPKQGEDGNWCWKSKNVNSDRIIDYVVNPKYSHYSSKLYDYEAYRGVTYI